MTELSHFGVQRYAFLAVLVKDFLKKFRRRKLRLTG